MFFLGFTSFSYLVYYTIFSLLLSHFNLGSLHARVVPVVHAQQLSSFSFQGIPAELRQL